MMDKKIESVERMLKRLHDDYYSDVMDNLNELFKRIDIEKTIENK